MVKLDLKRSILDSQYNVGEYVKSVSSRPYQEYNFSSRSSWTLNIATQ